MSNRQKSKKKLADVQAAQPNSPQFAPAPIVQTKGTTSPSIQPEWQSHTDPAQDSESSQMEMSNPLAEMFGHSSSSAVIQRSPDLSAKSTLATNPLSISSAAPNVIQRADSVTGEVFYHAAPVIAWQSIQQSGLDPNYGGNGEGWSKTDETMADSRGKVFFHRSIKAAKDTAANLADRGGSGGAVILAYTTETDGELREGGTMGGHWTDQLVPGNKLRVVATYPETAKPKKKRCFLTTACVQWRGLPDDCQELTVLREFRDGYLQGTASGDRLITTYYQIAPQLVERIETSDNPGLTLEWIYGIVCQCVTAINQDNPEQALHLYRAMVNQLITEFGPDKH